MINLHINYRQQKKYRRLYPTECDDGGKINLMHCSDNKQKRRDNNSMGNNLNVLLLIIIFFCSADIWVVQANLSTNKINNQRSKQYNVMDFGAIGGASLEQLGALNQGWEGFWEASRGVRVTLIITGCSNSWLPGVPRNKFLTC